MSFLLVLNQFITRYINLYQNNSFYIFLQLTILLLYLYMQQTTINIHIERPDEDLNITFGFNPDGEIEIVKAITSFGFNFLPFLLQTELIEIKAKCLTYFHRKI